MMSESKKKRQQLLVFGAGALAIGALGYFFYSQSQSQNDDDEEDIVTQSKQYPYTTPQDTLPSDQYEEDVDEQEQEQEQQQSQIKINDKQTPYDESKDESEERDEFQQAEETEETGPPTKTKEQLRLESDIKKYESIKQKVDRIEEFKYSNGMLTVLIHRCKNLPTEDKDSESDPFVKVSLPGSKEYQTAVIENNNNPVWNKQFEFNVKDAVNDSITFKVWDKDNFTANDHLGTISVPIVKVLQNNAYIKQQWFHLKRKKGTNGEIQLTLQYTEQQIKQ